MPRNILSKVGSVKAIERTWIQSDTGSLADESVSGSAKQLDWI